MLRSCALTGINGLSGELVGSIGAGLPAAAVPAAKWINVNLDSTVANAHTDSGRCPAFVLQSVRRQEINLLPPPLDRL